MSCSPTATPDADASAEETDDIGSIGDVYGAPFDSSAADSAGDTEKD